MFEFLMLSIKIFIYSHQIDKESIEMMIESIQKR